MSAHKYRHWTIEEHAIIEFFRERGDTWASIAARLDDRRPADVSQYWRRQTATRGVNRRSVFSR